LLANDSQGVESGPEEENLKSGSLNRSTCDDSVVLFVVGLSFFFFFLSFNRPKKSLGIGWSQVEENLFHRIKSAYL